MEAAEEICPRNFDSNQFLLRIEIAIFETRGSWGTDQKILRSMPHSDLGQLKLAAVSDAVLLFRASLPGQEDKYSNL
jgi:hypothetical protein